MMSITFTASLCPSSVKWLPTVHRLRLTGSSGIQRFVCGRHQQPTADSQPNQPPIGNTSDNSARTVGRLVEQHRNLALLVASLTDLFTNLSLPERVTGMCASADGQWPALKRAINLGLRALTKWATSTWRHTLIVNASRLL